MFHEVEKELNEVKLVLGRGNQVVDKREEIFKVESEIEVSHTAHGFSSSELFNNGGGVLDQHYESFHCNFD